MSKAFRDTGQRDAKSPTSRLNRLWLVALVLSIVGFATLGSGCVYYNLYYNIKRTYNEAEKDQRAPDGKATRQTQDK